MDKFDEIAGALYREYQKQMASEDKCERCGRFTKRQPHKLIGGYSVVLCLPCVNGWHETMMTHPDFIEHGETSNLLQYAARNGQYDEFVRCDARLRELSDRLYFFGKEWVAAQANTD